MNNEYVRIDSVELRAKARKKLLLTLKEKKKALRALAEHISQPSIFVKFYHKIFGGETQSVSSKQVSQQVRRILSNQYSKNAFIDSNLTYILITSGITIKALKELIKLSERSDVSFVPIDKYNLLRSN